MFFHEKAFSGITPLQPTTLANLSIHNLQRTTSTILTLSSCILSSYLLKSIMLSTTSIPNIFFNSFVNSATNCDSDCHIQEWWTCFFSTFLLLFKFLLFFLFSFFLSSYNKITLKYMTYNIQDRLDIKCAQTMHQRWTHICQEL